MAPKNSHGVTNLRATGFCLVRLARFVVSAGSLLFWPCRHSLQPHLSCLFWALELHLTQVSCCSLGRQGKCRGMRGKRSPLPLSRLPLAGWEARIPVQLKLLSAFLPTRPAPGLGISRENPYVEKGHTLNEPLYTILVARGSFLSDYNSI